MTETITDPVHKAVREHYATIARAQQSDDACCASGCCNSLSEIWSPPKHAEPFGKVTPLGLILRRW